MCCCCASLLPSPDDDGQRIFVHFGAAQFTAAQSGNVIFLQPRSYFIASKPEADMGVIFAEELQIMSREIDDHDTAAGAQYANGFSKGGFRIVEEVQHLMDDYGIGAGFGKGQVVDVGKPDAAIGKACIIEADAGASQHLAVRVRPRCIVSPVRA